jgi:hypothetical protein
MGRRRWSWGSRNTASNGSRILLVVDELRSCAAPTQPRPREEGVLTTGDGGGGHGGVEVEDDTDTWAPHVSG